MKLGGRVKRQILFQYLLKYVQAPKTFWAVRISAYYTGFASLIEGFNSPTVQKFYE